MALTQRRLRRPPLREPQEARTKRAQIPPKPHRLARLADRLLRRQPRRILQLLDHVPVRPQRQLSAMPKLTRDVDRVATLVQQERRERVAQVQVVFCDALELEGLLERVDDRHDRLADPTRR